MTTKEEHQEKAAPRTYPHIVFYIGEGGDELLARLERRRKRLSRKEGRDLSTSEVVRQILKQALSREAA